jgi:hypothetical protein
MWIFDGMVVYCLLIDHLLKVTRVYFLECSLQYLGNLYEIHISCLAKLAILSLEGEP